MKISPPRIIQLNGKLWRLQPDLQGKLLAVELRNPQHLEVVIIDTTNGKTLLLPKLAKNNTVLQLASKYVLMAQFENELPLHSGLQVWDYEKKQCIWEGKYCTPVSLTEQALYIKNIDRYQCLRLADLKLMEAPEMPDTVNNVWRYPTLYTPESAYFKTCSDYILKLTGHQPVWSCEYLEHESGILLLYYICSGENYEQWLIAIDDDGRKIFHTVTTRELKAKILQTFLLSRNRLVYVKDNDKISISNIQ